jgi:hypothetical protein
MGDRKDYSDTGMRGREGREGFGDDMGTRVGRPDGAREASQSGGTRPGQPGTNRDAVPDGIEGSIMDEDAGQARGAQERRSEDDGLHGSGLGQSKIQDSAREGDDVNRPAGDNRRIDDL